MDVLEYWMPSIEWGRFNQGPISDRMWLAFKNLVLLCHAYGHWRDATRAARLNRPVAPMYTPESRHMRNKRLREWRRPIEQCEDHMYRAAVLADEKIAEMSYLVSRADEGKPDWNLYFACALSVARSLGRDRARYNSVAFMTFDARSDLAGADPSVIAKRWLINSGHEADPAW